MTQEQWQMFKALKDAELGRGILAERFVRQYASTAYAQVADVALTERQEVWLLFLHHRYRRQLEHVCTERCARLPEQLQAVAKAELKEHRRATRTKPTAHELEVRRLEQWNENAKRFNVSGERE